MYPTVSRIEKDGRRIPDDWDLSDSARYETIIENKTVRLKRDTEFAQQIEDGEGCHEYKVLYFLVVDGFVGIDAWMSSHRYDRPYFRCIISELRDQLDDVENGLRVLADMKRDIEEAIAVLEAKQKEAQKAEEEAIKKQLVEVRDERDADNF
jgi:uncharacterized protein YdcH (DUF465 family)